MIPRISKVIPARRITLKEISNLHPESHEEAPMPVTFDFDNDAQTVYETLTDPQFLVDRCIALGELSAECDIEESGSVITIKLVREIKRDLPRALAKVFNPVQTIEMTETWMPNGDNWSGNWVLKVLGQPVTVFGDFELGIPQVAVVTRYRIAPGRAYRCWDELLKSTFSARPPRAHLMSWATCAIIWVECQLGRRSTGFVRFHTAVTELVN